MGTSGAHALPAGSATHRKGQLSHWNALDIIPTLDGPFDLVWMDADKENYSRYFDLVIDKVSSGGWILADNVLWSGKVVDAAGRKDTRAPALQ